MKKIILSVMAVLAFGYANAQDKEVKEAKEFGFSKGNIFIEGQLSFSSSKETNSFEGKDFEEIKKSNTVFTPKAGYFISDDFAIGVQLAMSSSKEENTDLITPATDESKISGFGAGVFARYYFLNLGQRFKTYTELGLAFGSSKKRVNSVETNKIDGFGVGLDLGMNYFVTPKMAISFGLSNVLAFNATNDKDVVNNTESKTNSFSGNLNLFNNFFDTPTFGLLYKF
ncbi:MAG: outer membrane beta-barrel protein [Burkholderiales bacterium]|nr:outer membrane beta-barrel protein [Flavobacterium sp.]